MRVGSHSVEARKAAFFVAEQLLLFTSFVGATMLVARAVGAPPDWIKICVEAAVATGALQLALYLADLYDFKVAYQDAPKAARLLKALGATTILCGIGTLLLPGASVARARPSDLVFSDGFERPAWLLAARRLVSLLTAAVLFVLAAPILLISALLIKIDSRGPLFYTQERVGQNGHIFRMMKFRTMRTDAESAGSPVWAQKDDPRVTRVGKYLRRFRIDELPQIFNVIRGEMGIV